MKVVKSSRGLNPLLKQFTPMDDLENLTKCCFACLRFLCLLYVHVQPDGGPHLPAQIFVFEPTV